MRPRVAEPLTLAICLTAVAIALIYKRRRRQEKRGERSSGYESLIGHTPLIKLERLSSLLGHGKCVYAKMECMNPGGSGKDRAALNLIRSAEDDGGLPLPISIAESALDEVHLQRFKSAVLLSSHDSSIKRAIIDAVGRTKTGGIVVEGSSGSTGISLATLASQRGHAVIIVMPDDQAKEKRSILDCLGASVHVVPTAAISNPNHYVNVAKRIADFINITDQKEASAVKLPIRLLRAAFMNQFENEANYDAHYATTGPEIMSQTLRLCGKQPDAFVMSSGTGGTISGVAHFLRKFCKKQCRIVLVDPPGSCLYNKIKMSVAYTTEQQERRLQRHRYDTIAEGIGLDRITQNFAIGLNLGLIDDAVKVTDQEAIDMAYWLLRNEGIFCGSSSAMNVSAAMEYTVTMPSDSCVVTIICDGGQRHLSRFWNRDFIIEWGLQWPGDDMEAWNDRILHKLHKSVGSL